MTSAISHHLNAPSLIFIDDINSIAYAKTGLRLVQ